MRFQILFPIFFTIRLHYEEILLWLELRVRNNTATNNSSLWADGLYRSGPCCGGRWTGCAGRWPQLGPPCQSRSAAAPPGWEDLSPCAPWLGCSWTTGGQTERMVWLLFLISTLNVLGRLSEYTLSAASKFDIHADLHIPTGELPNTTTHLFFGPLGESRSPLWHQSSSFLSLTHSNTHKHTQSFTH